ncbi:MAG: FHA domain-containing protein [Acidobacteriaceae bacterium]|nr:FHA domain-containing protein [Acidobacteriaceae bacterium]
MEKVARVIGKSLADAENLLTRVFGGLGKVSESQEQSPIEIRQAVVREVDDRIESRGKGDFFLPFEKIEVQVFAPTPERRDALLAAFSNDTLESEVLALLTTRRCRTRPEVTVQVIENPSLSAADQPWSIKWIRQGDQPAPSRPKAVLKVLQGKSDTPEVAIERDRVYLGRLKDVKDRRNGVVRRNDVAFDDSETTIARRHAMLVWSPDSGGFRLLNDPSNALGTTILRGGTVIQCDSVRGVQIQSADEIAIGNGRVLFELANSSGPASEP